MTEVMWPQAFIEDGLVKARYGDGSVIVQMSADSRIRPELAGRVVPLLQEELSNPDLCLLHVVSATNRALRHDSTLEGLPAIAIAPSAIRIYRRLESEVDEVRGKLS